MALKKKEVIIRPSSSATKEAALNSSLTWLNGQQNHSSNKNGSGYIDHFFCDVFDSRTNDLYRIFSDACEVEYGLEKVNGMILFHIIKSTPTTTPTAPTVQSAYILD